jgi:hypothetical protein
MRGHAPSATCIETRQMLYMFGWSDYCNLIPGHSGPCDFVFGVPDGSYWDESLGKSFPLSSLEAMTKRHVCHANGCEVEAHPEIPFCKGHFGTLPQPHKDKIWKGRPKGRCAACGPDDQDVTAPKRSSDWNFFFNLAVAIFATLEAPDYAPMADWLDAQGYCWMGGLQEAEKTLVQAKAAIKKYDIKKAVIV